VKFGINLIANTVISIVFSIVFFDALLMTVGPLVDPCSAVLLGPRSATRIGRGEMATGTVLATCPGGLPQGKPPSVPSSPSAGYAWSSYEDGGEKGPTKPYQATFNPEAMAPTTVTTPTRGQQVCPSGDTGTGIGVARGVPQIFGRPA